MSIPTGTTVTHISSEASFQQHIRDADSTTLQVIYFHAPWAEPCKQMSAAIESLASDYSSGVCFLSVDAEDVSEISEQYNVTQVPYIVLQRGSDALETISGGDVGRVRAAVDKHSGGTARSSAPTASSIPPAQKVTPRESSGSDDGTSNDLSSYAPGADDPATAPEYSSGASADAKEAKEKLHVRLAELVKAAPVMLFMKGTPSAPQCGFSRQTVSVLREKGVRYGFFNILADDEVRQGLKEFSDWPTFPQVYAGGELLGGLDILKEEFENDPDFLSEYIVSRQRNSGGPAAPEAQAAPA